MSNTRMERDSMGEMAVAATALYGASTARALANFPISGRCAPRALIQALGWIKHAAAETSAELGVLDEQRAKLIVEAARAVTVGSYDDQFPVDMMQTGSGTSTNMNVNEVIAKLANRAYQTREQAQSETVWVHPNDHVNAGQSSNDVYPSAVHIAVKGEIERSLLPALTELQEALAAKSEEFADVIKSGRTHLQDAVPITLGQEFAGYAWQIGESVRRARRGAEELSALALGGTAVGTGVNTHPAFAGRATAKIAALSGLAVRETEHHVAAQAAPDALLDTSGALRCVAIALMKVANDIRWLASGPTAGLGELRLPAVQPGSSIMPGKVNPVIAESLLMACATVLGNDAAVTVAAQWSQFELHTMWPLLADRLLESVTLLTNSARNFAKRAVCGIEVDRKRCAAQLMHNPAVATVLAPALGYDRVATWVKQAQETGEQVLTFVPGRTDVVQIGDELVPVAWLTGPHLPGSSEGHIV